MFFDGEYTFDVISNHLYIVNTKYILEYFILKDITESTIKTLFLYSNLHIYIHIMS